MQNKLSSLFQGSTYNPQGGGTFNPQAGTAINPSGGTFNPQTRTQVLPNAGGTYNPAGKSTITPTPVAPVVSAPTAPVVQEETVDFYAKYRDPKTGEVMSPEEYAIYLGNKVPKGTGQITNYAGDALTNPNQTTAELTGRATDLNNARNDIATGTTDPFGVGNKSGIAYSPKELEAIENAYAGIYDPALKDVFSRLQEKQDVEKKTADKEAIIFKTNENIRQWRATTGTKKTGSEEAKDLFTQTQINTGAGKAGLSIKEFELLDEDLKNFYINTPMAMNDEDKKVPIYQNFNEDFERVTAGDLSAEELKENISNSTLAPAVKIYFINQIPETPDKKPTIFDKEWWWG